MTKRRYTERHSNYLITSGSVDPNSGKWMLSGFPYVSFGEFLFQVTSFIVAVIAAFFIFSQMV